MLPEEQERQSRKWRTTSSEGVVALVILVCALIFLWTSIVPNDSTGGAPQHARVVVHDPEAEHIRAQSMALACAAAVRDYSYTRPTRGQVLEKVYTGVNDIRMKTHDAYYTDDTIEFVGVRYRGISGNVICYMDGKRVVAIWWNFPQTGRKIQLWRNDR